MKEKEPLPLLHGIIPLPGRDAHDTVALDEGQATGEGGRGGGLVGGQPRRRQPAGRGGGGSRWPADTGPASPLPCTTPPLQQPSPPLRRCVCCRDSTGWVTTTAAMIPVTGACPLPGRGRGVRGGGWGGAVDQDGPRALGTRVPCRDEAGGDGDGSGHS